MFGGIDIMRLRNLRILSKLEVGDKLCTRQHPFTIMTESTNLLSIPMHAIFRWTYSESRTLTVDAISSLIISVVEYGQNSSEQNRQKIAEELLTASRGIACLVETYRDDRTAVSSLEIILDTIRTYVSTYGASNDRIELQPNPNPE